jgi:hypothetical protein
LIFTGDSAILFGKSPKEKGVTGQMKKEWRKWLPTVFFIAALGMCVYGAVTGQAEDVLRKAIRICMECIGLG